MDQSELTCARVSDEDLDVRYLAGTLPEDEAQAFEAHFFGCDRCWATVQRGLEVRAAEATATAHGPASSARAVTPPDDAIARGTRRARRTSSLVRRWIPLAAAAALVIVAVSRWPTGGDDAERGVAALRGEGDSLLVRPDVRGANLFAAWSPVAGADLYRARLFARDGALVWAMETSDTIVSVARDSLRGAATAYWDVQALDRLRAVIARSGPTAVRLAP